MKSDHDAVMSLDLLEHRPFVKRLARALVADVHGAEDLEQDVWTAALAGGPRGAGQARAWLARVARNLAANRARGEARRRAREAQVAPREEGALEDSALDGAERALETQRRVLDAVHRLSEPYRAVILLRYLRELSHAEIAAQTGAPLATVRSRLQRGLAQLREVLEREQDERGEPWLQALVALGDVGVTAGATGARAGFAWLAALKWGAVAAALALTSWTAWRLGASGADPVLREDSHVAPEGGGVEEIVLQPGGAEARRTAQAADGAALPVEAAILEGAGWFVEGRVQGLAGDEPTAGTVSVKGITAYVWPEERTARARLLPDGTFRVDLTDLVLRTGGQRVPLRALDLVVDHPRFLPESVRLHPSPEHRIEAELAELTGPITWSVEVRLRRAAAITGRVTLPDGAAVPHAAVYGWRMADGAPLEDVAGQVACDDDGRFLLRLPYAGQHVIAARVEGRRPGTEIMEAILGRSLELAEPLVLEDGARLEGSVMRLGKPQAEAGVRARLDWTRLDVRPKPLTDRSPRLVWIQGRVEHDDAQATTSELGTWQLGGLRPGPYDMSTWPLRGYDVSLGGRYPTQPVEAPNRGVIVDFSRSALRFESVRELPGDAKGTMRFLHGSRPGWHSSLSGDGGLPAVLGVPGEAVTFEIRMDGFRTWRRELELPQPGEERVVSVDLIKLERPAALDVRFAEGTEYRGEVTLALYSRENQEEPVLQRTVESAGGAASFERLEPGDYRALVMPSQYLQTKGSFETHYLRWVELDLSLREDERRTLPVEFEVGGRVSVRARDAAGAVLPAEVELLDSSGRELDVFWIASDGSMNMINTWRLSPEAPNESYPTLSPGKYSLRLHLDGFEEQVIPVEIEPGRTAQLEVELVAAP